LKGYSNYYGKCKYQAFEAYNYFKKNPDLVKLSRMLGKYKESSNIPGMFLDVHDKNIMQRADGTIVITDPYASFGGS
jgi:hypothetical protein